MPLDPEAILSRAFPNVRQVVTERDCMLYALSLGLGADPVNPRELAYVYEKGLEVFPTMPVILGRPGVWMDDPRLGITRSMAVHGAQQLELLGPVPIGGTVSAINKVVEVIDKGRGGGAVLVVQRWLTDASTGAPVATLRSTIFCRGDGGFGGKRAANVPVSPIPDRPPDVSADIPISSNAALLYRLNGDVFPLHADPEVARAAGFERPILHGLCTFGMAAAAVIRHFGRNGSRSLATFESRFSHPVTPGETLKIDMWDSDGHIAFSARSRGGGAKVLEYGRASFR